MNSLAVSAFIELYRPERKVYWDALTEEERIKIENSHLINSDMVRILCNPQKYPKLVENFRNKTDELQLLLSHPECTYDVYSFYHLKEVIKSKGIRLKFNSKYDELIQNQDKYAIIKDGVRVEKSTAYYLSKIHSCYKMRGNIQDGFIGYFKNENSYNDIEMVTFFSDFEILTIPRFLIPAFIEYRNKHLLEWIYEALSSVNMNEQKADSECINKLHQIQLIAENSRQEYYEYQENLIKEIFPVHSNLDMAVGSEGQIDIKTTSGNYTMHETIEFDMKNYRQEIIRLKKMFKTEETLLQEKQEEI